jgi:hypothetical protein
MKVGYDFVDKFAALESMVHGSGHRARFSYWNHTFAYLKAMGELSCALGEYARAVNQLVGLATIPEQQNFARQNLLPLRVKAVRLLETIYDHLFATIGSPGELGTVANWEQHILPDLFIKPGDALENLLGQRLPPEAQLSAAYRGSPRLIVPSTRGCFRAGEELNVRALILSSEPVVEAALYWREMGQGDFAKVNLSSVARGVYAARWTAGNVDLEYHVKVLLPKGDALWFPAAAPALNQTMIALPAGN